MSYQYDVFLSYVRKFPHGQWVDEIFYLLFVSYLEDALNLKKVSVFKDTEEIIAGSAWPERLKHAAIHSRCMISIFSPAYFMSEWCMKEFAIMYYRQKQLGYLTQDNPEGLIVPVKIFDGEHFPDHVNALQMLDCRDVFLVGEGMKQAKSYLDLQLRLRRWVYDVAKVIRSTPEWDDQWLKKNWVEPSAISKMKKTATKMGKPIL